MLRSQSTLATPLTLWSAWIRFLIQSNCNIWKPTMSDRDFTIPSEDQPGAPLFLANRGRLLDIDGNYSLSLSPDSAGCNFNLSERRDCTAPDINTLSSGGPMRLPNNTTITLPQEKLFTHLENTFIATPDDSSINFWNHNLSLLSCQDSEGNKTFYKTASEGSNSAAVSPDSAGMSSCRTSCRGSMDLSLSSAEMVVRSNSFVLEQQASGLSSLEDSPAPPDSSHAESKSLLASLNEPGGTGDKAGDQPCFGMTFVLGDKVEFPSEEHEATSNSSYLALPGEKDGHHTNFKSVPSDVVYFESELLNESKPVSQARINLCEASIELSTEMVVRSNSFILEEHTVPSVMSSIGESPAPPTSSHIESNCFLTPLSVKGGTSDQAGDNPCFGMTFVLGDNVELPSEEDGGMSSSFLALPGDREGLRTTFLYENSQSDIANDAQFIYSEVELLNESKPLETPDQAMTFEPPLCSVLDDKDIHTSTPVQNLGSHMPSLPSFAASPCTENAGSPALRPVLRKKSSVTPKQSEKGTTISGNKVTKMEVNKLPKSDMSNVKCKVIRKALTSSILLDKPPQINTKDEGNKVETRPSPTRIHNGTTTPVPKTVHNPQRKPHISADKDQVNLQRTSTVSEEVQAKSKTVYAPLNTDANKHTPVVCCSLASPDTEQGASGQANADPKAHIANATFCYPEKSPPKNDRSVPKPAPKNDMTNKIKKVKSGSALGHNKPNPNTPNPRPRSSSESATVLSRLFKMATPQRFSASFSLTKSKNENPKSLKKLGVQDNSQSKPGPAKETPENSCRKVKKLGLVSDPSTLSAACSETKTRVRGQPFPNLSVRASTSKSSAANPITTTTLNKHQPGTSGRECSRSTSAVGTPLLKNKNTSNRKAPGETSLGSTPTSNKSSSSQTLRTPSRSSLMGPPPTPVSRLQRKPFGPSRNQPGPSESGVQSETSDSVKTTPVSSGVGRRATPFKVPILKPRFATTPAKTSAPVFTAPCKSMAPSKGLTKGPVSPQKRTASTATKLFRLPPSVDKKKPKAGPRPQQQQQSERGSSRPQQDVGPAGVIEARRDGAMVQRLREQLAQSNSRFEALAVVLQRTLAQRDEAAGQSRGLSQELLELKGELVSSVNRSECLVQEKECLKAALQEALEQVQAQHHRDLQELEQRLRDAHDEERRAAEQRSREERKRSAQTLQQQMQELEVAHEALRLNLEQSHSHQLQSLRQQHQLSLQELSTSHTQELQALSKTLQEAETVLNEKIQELTQENEALMKKLTEEENRRKEMSQKDPHTVYLEQELESLKVVLDMKNQQLHQQEKKLMEVDKLTEKSLKLGESLKKVQQENEDLKARMDRHAALSRQLSTEQAQLQESLQKESKMNKRLSMENEELMWKLHNGDVSSPRRSSPGSPSPHFGALQSPRSPSLFSSPPVSPR